MGRLKWSEWWNYLYRANERRTELLTINQRNIECVFEHNPRKLLNNVDDKVLAKEVLQRAGIPTPPTLCIINNTYEIRGLQEKLGDIDQFALKPARGYGGGGILLIHEKTGDRWVTGEGKLIDLNELSEHVYDIIGGVYSLGNKTEDTAIFERLLKPHLDYKRLSYKGIPDVRVIVSESTPIMAMLRCPTSRSAGKANLHAGGVGVGIDLETGQTTSAIIGNSSIKIHPDTRETLIGIRLPLWEDAIHLAERACQATGLGYVGVDTVVDEELGPLVLEVNARPGLNIQLANMEGLNSRIQTSQKKGAEYENNV